MQETDELRGEIAERNEAAAFFAVDSEFMSTRAACFTQTAEEEYNVREFGNVILLDETAIDNHLRWDTFPVAVLDRNCQIASGGIFFLGLQNSDVFQWVLATIQGAKKISSPPAVFRRTRFHADFTFSCRQGEPYQTNYHKKFP
jgi:hypothetical protein